MFNIKDEVVVIDEPIETNDIDQLISEVSLITQAPKPIIFASFLSVLSSTCQGFLDVEIKPGLSTPTSLYTLVIAESGERKSTVDNILFNRLIDINRLINKTNEQFSIAYKRELAQWNINRKFIEKQYNKALTKSNDITTFQSQLDVIHENKPKLIEFTSLLYNDITIEALLYNLSKCQPNTTLTSSDAGNLLKRFNYQYLSHLNMIWDGDSISVDRKNEDGFLVQDARLSISLMVQPNIFYKIITKNSVLRDSGALARMLIINSYSTQGERMYSEQSDHKYLSQFYNRITILHEKLLQMTVNKATKIVVKMSPEAKCEWIDFYNNIESRLGDGDLADINDFASKIANNVARVAALLHYYLHDNEKICKECMVRAIKFGHDCIDSFKSYFGEKTVAEKAGEYADILYQWLTKNSQGRISDFLKSHIYHYGPNCMRNKENLEMALWKLHDDHKIAYYYDAKPKFIRVYQRVRVIEDR